MRKAGDIMLDLFNNYFGSDFMETARSNAGLFIVLIEEWSPAQGSPPIKKLFTISRARAIQGKNRRGSGVYEL